MLCPEKINLDNVLDGLEHGGILCHTHAEEFLRPPVLVEVVVRVLPELFHVSTNKHLAELDEIAMLLVVYFDDAPWVRPSTHVAAVRCLYDFVRAHNGEGNLAGDLLRFR